MKDGLAASRSSSRRASTGSRTPNLCRPRASGAASRLLLLETRGCMQRDKPNGGEMLFGDPTNGAKGDNFVASHRRAQYRASHEFLFGKAALSSTDQRGRGRRPRIFRQSAAPTPSAIVRVRFALQCVGKGQHAALRVHATGVSLLCNRQQDPQILQVQKERFLLLLVSFGPPTATLRPDARSTRAHTPPRTPAVT